MELKRFNLSIVIPTYNLEKNICKTLESLINQTQKEFEIVVVDDGSTDQTLRIIEKAMEQNTLIPYKIIKTSNKGVSSARNTGITETSGDYIIFLDGDDYIAADLVETVILKINKNNADVICWGFDIVSEENKNIIKYFDRYKKITQSISGIEALNHILTDESMWISTGSAAYKKEFLIKNNIRYIEGCCSGEDQEFTYKSLARAKEVVFINKTLFFYVKRSSSQTMSYNLKKFDAVNAFKRIYDYINSMRSKDFEGVLTKIHNKYIIDSYMSNYDSCLYSLISARNCKKIMRNDIFSDIEKHYPELNKELRTLIINVYKKSKTSKPILLKMFLISPIIYNLSVLLKIKLKEVLEKFKLLCF